MHEVRSEGKVQTLHIYGGHKYYVHYSVNILKIFPTSLTYGYHTLPLLWKQRKAWIL